MQDPTRLTVPHHIVSICHFEFHHRLIFKGGGRRVVYGTDDGVYLSDLREINQEPVKVLALLDVMQVDVLEDYQLLIVLSGMLFHSNL